MSSLELLDQRLPTEVLASADSPVAPPGEHISLAAAPASSAAAQVSPTAHNPQTANHTFQPQAATCHPDDVSADAKSPAVAVKTEGDQPTDSEGSSPRTGSRKVSTKDIQLVQNLIERCLQLYMSQREVVTTLHAQAEVEPGFTGLVWQKLEEQNSNFFQAYYTRLKLKDQILLFNHLLDQQMAVAQRMQWSRTVPQPAVPNMQLLPGLAGIPSKGLDTSATPMAASPLGDIFGDIADLDNLNQSSVGGPSMGAAPASPPLFVSDAAHHQGLSTLGVGHMSSDNLMGLGNLTSTSPVAFGSTAGDPPIPHVFSMSDIDRHLDDLVSGDDDAPPLDLDSL